MSATAMIMATMMDKATIFQQTFRNSGKEKSQTKPRQDNTIQRNTKQDKTTHNQNGAQSCS